MIWLHTKPLWHLRHGFNIMPRHCEFAFFLPLGPRKHHPPIWRLYLRFRRWNGKPQIIVDLAKLLWAHTGNRWMDTEEGGCYGTETKFAIYWPDWGWKKANMVPNLP